MLDDAPPPTKRMRLQTGTKSQPSVIQKENTCPNPKPDDRKRKIPAKRSAPSNVIDLNADVLLEVFDFLSIQDLCSLAETTNGRMVRIVELSFKLKCKNGVPVFQNGQFDYLLLQRVLNNFGHLITSINISTGN